MWHAAEKINASSNAPGLASAAMGAAASLLRRCRPLICRSCLDASGKRSVGCHRVFLGHCCPAPVLLRHAARQCVDRQSTRRQRCDLKDATRLTFHVVRHLAYYTHMNWVQDLQYGMCVARRSFRSVQHLLGSWLTHAAITALAQHGCKTLFASGVLIRIPHSTVARGSSFVLFAAHRTNLSCLCGASSGPLQSLDPAHPGEAAGPVLHRFAPHTASRRTLGSVWEIGSF